MVIVNKGLVYDNIVLELVNNKYDYSNHIHKGRPSKLTNNDFLVYMKCVNKTGCGWNYLNPPHISGNAIKKRFYKWSNDNIFKEAYNILLYIYEYLKLDFENIFIDASHIKNMLGIDCVGSNHYDRVRLSTKLSKN